MVINSSTLYAIASDNVIDELDYLSQDEIDALQVEMEALENSRQLETVIVITDNTNGKSSMAYADDYFDYNGYGVGEEHSGLLMLVNMDARELWISTTGRAIDVFNDQRIATMVDKITPYLSDENYYKACQSFLNLVDSYAEKGVPEGAYRVDSNTGVVTEYREEGSTYIEPTYLEKLVGMMTNGIVYVVALIIAIIATVVLTLSRKGKVTINNLTYEEKGSFALTQQEDRFIREAVTRVKVVQNNTSGGGGSSTHTGSSGTSHGGGGGKF